MARWGRLTYFFILLGTLMLDGSARANVDEHVLQTPDGAEHFLVHPSINSNGEYEVQVEHEESRAFVPGHTSTVILYGRDLDGDGKVDAWFYPDESGIIQVTEARSAQDDGWDAASQIILQKVQYKDRWLIGILAHSILSTLTFTESTGDRFQKTLIEEEIELKDFEVRVNRLVKQSPHDPNLLQYEQMLSDGWADLSKRISTEGMRNRFLYAAADVGMYLATAGLAKGLSKAGEWALPKILASAPGAWAEEIYSKIASGVTESFSRATERVTARAADLGLDAEQLERFKQAIRWPAVAGATQAAREMLTEKIPSVIRGLNGRGQVASLFARSADALGAVVKGALKQWKYIASTQALQIGVEIYERRDSLFSPNPIVFAKRILSDKDLLEDVGFMTWDSALAAGVSVADPNLKRRMVICGVLSLVNSTGASLLLKKEPDKTRAAIDTGWETVVGNIETQIDLAALSSFEKLAIKSGNPKLELLGYAAALIDDGIGYWGYEKITQKYEKNKARGGLQWIPILGQR